MCVWGSCACVLPNQASSFAFFFFVFVFAFGYFGRREISSNLHIHLKAVEVSQQTSKKKKAPWSLPSQHCNYLKCLFQKEIIRGMGASSRIRRSRLVAMYFTVDAIQ